MKKNLLSLSLFIGFVLLSDGLMAQSKNSNDQMVLKNPPTWGSRSRGAHFSIGLESGLISFQDIQVPTNELAGERADGTPSAGENNTHFGIPISGFLSLAYRTPMFEPRIRLEAMHTSSMLDPPKSSQSSYDRIDASLGFALRFNESMKSGQSAFGIDSDLHMRRSMFANRSSSHYIDTFMPTLGAGWYQDHGFNFMVNGGYGIYSVFAYDAGKSGKAGELAGSKAQLSQWNADLSYRNTTDTSVVLGVGQELATIELADTGAYETFGLSIPEFERQSRAYSLTTTFIKLGYSRRF